MYRFFLCATPRKLRLHAFFQLLAATFLLKAWEGGLFFDQKLQLAGNDQTDRCAKIAAGALGYTIAYARRATFVRRYVELAGVMKKMAAQRRANRDAQACQKNYFPSLAIWCVRRETLRLAVLLCITPF